MDKTNLLQKLAPVGVAAFGAISVIGIATAPARAVEGRLGFSDNTSDFFFAPPAVPVLGAPVADFDVDFVTSANDLVAVLNATGAFDPLFDPIETTVSTTPSADFINGNIVAILPATGLPEYEYELEDDLTFTLDATNTDDTATYTIGGGSKFLGEYVSDLAGNIESIEFELEIDAGSELCVNSECWTVTANAFEFEDLPGTGGGEFLSDAEVGAKAPEPASILGLLAIGGLGLGLKRKKQL